ncbi:MAG: sigma-54 interaction domain-containing protein [Planctomycetota bacterium]|jgi:PAS domain S-box-containing protein
MAAPDALSAGRFRSVFEHSHDAIFVVDPETHRIVEANPAACRMLGYSLEELRAKRPEDMHAHEAEAMAQFSATVLRDGHAFSGDLSCLAKSGDRVPVEVTGTLAEDGGTKQIVIMARDMRSLRRAEAETAYLREQIAGELHYGEIVGSSDVLQDLLAQIALVAPTDSSVLIQGESGTGKELVARAIHGAGPRAGRPMVKVNCGSIPRELFESEFFGHVKGAFTGALRDRQGRFELADGGTLFLDEVGEIPLDLQPKLLRVLQEGTFERVGDERTRTADVRVIAATNRDLAAEVDAGRFRRDLYYRLSVFPIQVPPLRDRCDDIPALVDHFARAVASRLGRPPKRVPPDVVPRLCEHDWPGNVRELQNLVERAVILSPGETLEIETPGSDGASGPDRAGDAAGGGGGEGPRVDLPAILTAAEMQELEKRNLQAALLQSGGKIYGDDGAAALLGLKPTTLASRLKKLGLK